MWRNSSGASESIWRSRRSTIGSDTPLPLFVAIHERLREELRGSQHISIDDTPLLTLNRDHPKSIRRGRQWMYIGDKCSVIYCEYTEDWKGSHPRKVLEGLDCDVQSDGYGGASLRSSDTKADLGASDAMIIAGASSSKRSIKVIAVLKM
ncbi:MAG: transposase [Myxococcales bacterium]|nr:transposase [Myxococcales bacterium]